MEGNKASRPTSTGLWFSVLPLLVIALPLALTLAVSWADPVSSSLVAPIELTDVGLRSSPAAPVDAPTFPPIAHLDEGPGASGATPVELPSPPGLDAPAAEAGDIRVSANDPRALPQDMVGKAELAARRTADSATVDLGDGTYALVQDTRPMHYRDEQGAWQPIVPAFAPVEGGWANQTNAVEIGLSEHSSDAKIGRGELGVGWEPSSLVATGGGGQIYQLARVLSLSGEASSQLSTDGRSVRYRGNWSDPALEDRWRSGPGSAEYTLHLDSLPATPSEHLPDSPGLVGPWSTAQPDSLELRVRLHLAPGTACHVDGEPVRADDLPLASPNAIAFASALGDQLWLQPPRAYEQDSPGAEARGSYELIPGPNPSTLELAVRLPWEWLAAEERQFPVVIDPLFQMWTGTVVRTAGYQQNGFFAGYYGPSVGLFRDMTRGFDFQARLFVKFEMPTMPLDTEVDQAYLVALPTGGDAGSAGNFIAQQRVTAYTLTNWIDSPPYAPDYEVGGSLGTETMGYSQWLRDYPDRGGTWDVTREVQRWINNQGTNHGMLLEAAPLCWTASYAGCGSLSFEQTGGLDEELAWIERHAVSNDPATVVTSTESGGVRLVVFYRGPELAEGDVVSTEDTAFGWRLGLPDADDPYFHTDHEYRLKPVPDGDWQAVVARGLGTNEEHGAGCPNPGLGEHCLKLKNLAGTVPLELRVPALLDAVALDTADWSEGHLNYLLLNGAEAQGDRFNVRVPPVGGENPALGYDVRLMGETGVLGADADNSRQVERSFDSREPMALWNVDFSSLPSRSNVRVDVEILGVNITKTGLPDLSTHASHFSARLFEGGTNKYLSLESGDRLAGTQDGGGAATCGSADLGSGIFTPDTTPGNYALVVTYDGPGGNLVEGSSIPTGGAPTAGSPLSANAGLHGSGRMDANQAAAKETPLLFDYRVRVTACSEGMFPTKSGQCQAINCPSTTFPSANRREADGLQLWSEDGWSGGTSSVGSHAPLIGPTDGEAPTVAVVGGQISFSGEDISLSPDSSVLLVSCGNLTDPTSPVGEASYFNVYDGEMARTSGMPWLQPLGDCRQAQVDPWSEEPAEDLTNRGLFIMPLSGEALGRTVLRRRVDGAQFSFQTSYSVTVGGWPSLTSTIERTDSNTPPTIASLILGLGDEYSLDAVEAGCKTCDRPFVQVRNSDAAISQPAELGGATKPVQALILSVNRCLPSDPKGYCEGSCIDLRALDDAYPHHENRQWAMPDVHTNVQAGTVMVRDRGHLQLYSVDHPASGLSPGSVSQEFSFDTFGASVSIGSEKCFPEDDHEVLVIRGETQLEMPNIGAVAAGFKLCETELRSVHFEFYSPVGIPLANSGLFLTGMRGQVDIHADYTQINFGLNFQTADGGNLFDGWGDVTIDTRGMFQFQGAGEILGLVDATGRLWVAWEPLDIGIDMSLVFELTDEVRLEGSVWAHMWQGQGWQHRYHWLPDNGDTHFSARIAAELTIEKGAAFSWWFMDIPPWEFSLGIEIAFGEFCTNASCTSYEWGMKGKLVICGYDIGMYFGFDHGIDFILGNDDHVLIDQYGWAAASLQSQGAGGADRVAVRGASPAVNGVSTETLQVSASAENLLLGLSWQAGAPELTLHDPDGTDVTLSSAYTVAISTTTNSELVGVQLKEPKAGAWNAVISNLTGEEHYKFIYFANKGAPGTPDDPGRFLTPGPGIHDGTDVYTITWEVPPGTPVSATISLYYSGYGKVNDYIFWWPYDELGRPVLRDVPIAKHVPFNQGLYVWDTSALKNYALYPDESFYVNVHGIRAVIDDGINDFPAGQVSDPRDPCQPRCELPGPQAFDPDRFPGVSTFGSLGYVVVADTVPPAPPTGLELEGVAGAILAQWDASPEKDLAAYIIRWGTYSRMLRTWLDYQEERVTAVTSPTVRLGGVVSGTVYHAAVRAVDANGNVSHFSYGLGSPPSAMPTGSDMDPVPLAPMSLTVPSQTSSAVHFEWSPAEDGAAPDSYRLIYQWLVDFDEIGGYTETFGYVDSSLPAAAVPVTSGPTPGGMRSGETYRVSVSAANSDGWTSAGSEPITVTVTNGVDGDGDGLPDDWAAAHQVFSFTHDADADGLENGRELVQGTDPVLQDSDGDGFSDWEEWDAGSDALDDRSFPAEMTQPRLELTTHHLVFRGKQGELGPGDESIIAFNAGGGLMLLAAETDCPWIEATVQEGGPHSDVVSVGVDVGGLSPGYYSGVVRVKPAEGSDPLIGGPQCIGVELWLSPPDDYVPLRALYMPIVARAGSVH